MNASHRLCHRTAYIPMTPFPSLPPHVGASLPSLWEAPACRSTFPICAASPNDLASGVEPRLLACAMGACCICPCLSLQAASQAAADKEVAVAALREAQERLQARRAAAEAAARQAKDRHARAVKQVGLATMHDARCIMHYAARR